MGEEKKEFIDYRVYAGYNYTVYRNENGERVFYKIGISQKQADGQKITGYMPVQFKRGVGVADKTKIKIKQAFERFYKKGYDTIFYLQIIDFEILDGDIEDYNQSVVEQDSYINDLPF